MIIMPIDSGYIVSEEFHTDKSTIVLNTVMEG